MGTENNSSPTNGKVEKLSVPPGFASLSSFTLTCQSTSEASCTSMAVGLVCEVEPTSMSSIASIIDVEKFKSNLGHRPWILNSQLSHNLKESDSETEMNLPLRTCLPKAVIRGCPSCPNCQKVIARWHPEEPHRPVLEEAPVFYPTDEEFKETLKYVASIRQKAEHIGVCRVVPPPSWQPPCLVSGRNLWENLKFDTHIQPIHELQKQFLNTKVGGVQEDMKMKRKVWVGSSEDGCTDGCPADANEAQCHTESKIFKSGPELTLKDFEKYADDFKRQYFCGKDKAISTNANLTMHQEEWEPSVENVEGEYWRIIENPSEEIEVLCSAKLETGVSGTGFPVKNHNSTETPKYSEYLESGWNLNNTFKLRGSLLCYENNGTSSALLPRLSVGMCFSSVCWKVEEHHLYSLCYMHLGGPRIWYVVPGRYRYKFEGVVKKHLPRCLEHPEMLYKNIPQLSPSTLIAEGIPVYRCMQYPREFVLIFPAAYNSQFGCGFNCSEAVNFAPFDWLPYGQHVTEMYSEQVRHTSISQDKLLLGAAVEAVWAQWQLLLLRRKLLDDMPWTTVCGKDGVLAKALKLRVKHEDIRREYLCKSLPSQKMEDNFDLHTKRECCICLYDLHLSAICCSCSPGRYSCLRHAKDLCSCSWTARCLLVRYEINELNILVEALEGKLDAVYKWAKQKLGLRMNSSDLKDAVRVPNHGEVSASPKAAALSPVSRELGSSSRNEKKEAVIQRVSWIEQKENDFGLQKTSPDRCSGQDTVKCVDSKLSNLTAKKRKHENSLSVQSDVIVLSDDEDE